MSCVFVVADDHPLFRGALTEILRSLPDGPTVVEACDFDEAEKAVARHPDADLLLLDLAMPGTSGLTGLAFLRAEHPGVPIAVVSATEDAATVSRALELGASGFIAKSSAVEEIRAAIDTLMRGEVYLPAGMVAGREADPEVGALIERIKTLTPQQTRVLTMLGRGLLNKQIAYELGISEATTKAHVSAVLTKLKVDSRTQAVISLSKLGVDLDTARLG